MVESPAPTLDRRAQKADDEITIRSQEILAAVEGTRRLGNAEIVDVESEDVDPARLQDDALICGITRIGVDLSAHERRGIRRRWNDVDSARIDPRVLEQIQNQGTSGYGNRNGLALQLLDGADRLRREAHDAERALLEHRADYLDW